MELTREKLKGKEIFRTFIKSVHLVSVCMSALTQFTLAQKKIKKKIFEAITNPLASLKNCSHIYQNSRFISIKYKSRFFFFACLLAALYVFECSGHKKSHCEWETWLRRKVHMSWWATFWANVRTFVHIS